MPNTRGHEIVAEVTVETLNVILEKAWKSGSDASDEGVIPEHIEIPSGTALGPYLIKDGTIQIPQEQLNLSMNTINNGVDITIGTIVQVEIENPPVQSAKYFDITADFTVKAPVRVKEEVQVWIILENLPDDGISALITNGNPLAPVTEESIGEFIHNRFSETDFPSVIDDIPLAFSGFSMLLRAQFFNDQSDPQKKITVSFPDAESIQLEIPTYIRLYEIEGSLAGFSLATPMGVNGTTVVIAPYTQTDSKITADFSAAIVELTNIGPADDPIEGANYTQNATLVAFVADLDDLIKSGFESQATTILKSAIGPVEVNIPSMEQIADFMESQLRQELDGRKNLFVWQAESPEDIDQEVVAIDTQALSGAIAIGINPGNSADLPAVSDFIPVDRNFSIALDRAKVIEELDKEKLKSYPSFPHTFADKIEGKTVKLNALNFDLRDGVISITGDITVVDAILDSIDVDASFDAETILEWEDNEDGSQSIKPSMNGDPDVSLGGLAWLLGFLLGFITAGIIGGIIAVVVIAVVERVASKIGGEVAKDEAADKLVVLKAWPQNLDNIGEVSARFLNPIGIDSNGILFSGSMLITSTHELTLIDAANSNGPYFSAGNTNVIFDGGIDKQDTAVIWDFDDGSSSNLRKPQHAYGRADLYISKYEVAVLQDGGVKTRSFASVFIENVPPIVSLPADIVVNEGEPFTIIGNFTDDNWLDTHIAFVDYGDNTAPIQLSVDESNDEPLGRGEVCISHTYCDNGEFRLRLTVVDDQGGVGQATMSISSLNVNPNVKLPNRINTLVGQPLNLQGEFSDAGWCDTHTGHWDLGDCSKVRKVIITESHKPPAAQGIAEIVHVFENCGRFESLLTITDDDGGQGIARMIVNANELRNPDMQLGFRELFLQGDLVMEVANAWYPYFSRHDRADGSISVAMTGEHIINNDGLWAQEIVLHGAGQAGIYQQIEVNRHWKYEFKGCFNFPVVAGNAAINATARIGIDPLGGIDPSAPQVVWSESGQHIDWQDISVRADALNDSITLFLGVNEWKQGRNTVRWDNARLFQLQCCLQVVDDYDEIVCLDFKDFKPEERISQAFDHRGFTITPLGKFVKTSLLGTPENVTKLAYPPEGVHIKLPEYTEYCSVYLNNYNGRVVEIALLRDGELILSKTEIVYNQDKIFEYQTSFINELVIKQKTDSGYESALIEVCGSWTK